MLCASIVAGSVLGLVLHRTSDSTILWSTVPVTGNLLVVFLALYGPVALAEDVRKPIWWLSADALRRRLYSWCIAVSWRLAIILCAGVVAASMAARTPTIVLYGIPAIVTILALLRGIGLALYALFPSNLDQRGPVAMVRMLLMYVLLAPPAAVGTLLGLTTHAVLGGMLAALATALTETILLAEFASYRIAGSGIGIAQAEES